MCLTALPHPSIPCHTIQRQEYRQELLTSANGAATAAGAAEAAKATGVLPGTPDIYLQPSLGMMGAHMHSPPPPVVQYRESPVSAASLGVGGKGAGSPADQRWDAAEWARALQRLGLDAQRLGQYVDNLRGALYSEIVALLDRLGEVVTDLEARYSVPRELMLDLRCGCLCVICMCGKEKEREDRANGMVSWWIGRGLC